jgi:hypothetical protein
MHEKVGMAIQEIDAAVFSGDTFAEREERDKLRAYVESWLRALDEADRDEFGRDPADYAALVAEMREEFVEILRNIARHAFDAVSLRCRWYETRRYDVPPHLMQTLRYLAEKLGISPTECPRVV